MPVVARAASPVKVFLPLLSEAIDAPVQPNDRTLAELARAGLDEAMLVGSTLMKAGYLNPGTPNRAVLDAFLAVHHYSGANDDYTKKFLRDALFNAYAAKLMSEFNPEGSMKFHPLGDMLRRVSVFRAINIG